MQEVWEWEATRKSEAVALHNGHVASTLVVALKRGLDIPKMKQSEWHFKTPLNQHFFDYAVALHLFEPWLYQQTLIEWTSLWWPIFHVASSWIVRIATKPQTLIMWTYFEVLTLWERPLLMEHMLYNIINVVLMWLLSGWGGYCEVVFWVKQLNFVLRQWFTLTEGKSQSKMMQFFPKPEVQCHSFTVSDCLCFASDLKYKEHPS